MYPNSLMYMLLLLAVRMKSYQLQALQWMRNRELDETDECFHQPSSSSLSLPNDWIQNGQNLPLQGVYEGDNEISKGSLIPTCIHIYTKMYIYIQIDVSLCGYTCTCPHLHTYIAHRVP